MAAAQARVGADHNPIPHGVEISRAFQALVLQAEAASREDADWVQSGKEHGSIWRRLDAIDALNGRASQYLTTEGRMDPGSKDAVTRLANGQLEIWEELNAHLTDYHDWLVDVVNRWWRVLPSRHSRRP